MCWIVCLSLFLVLIPLLGLPVLGVTVLIRALMPGRMASLRIRFNRTRDASGADGDGSEYDAALMRVLQKAMSATVGPVLARIEALEKRKAVTDRISTPHPSAGTIAAADSSSIRRSGAASALFPAASSNLMAAGSAPAVSQARVGVSARAFLQNASAGNNDGGDFDDFVPNTGVDDDKYGGPSGVAPTGPAPHPLFRPLAPEIIEDVGPGGFREWLRAEAPADSWRNARNQHECEILADVLDELVLRHDPDAAVELLVRRFVGIRQADRSGNWNFAQVLAKGNPRRTLLRPTVLSAVLREAKNLSLLESGGRANNSNRANNGGGSAANNRAGAKGGAQTAQSGRGGGNNNRRGKDNKSAKNAAPSQAARGAGSASAAGAAGSETDE